MIPLVVFLLGVRRRLPRRDRGGVQRADAAVAAAGRRAQRSARRARRVPRRSAAAVHPGPAAARPGHRRAPPRCSRAAIGIDGAPHAARSSSCRVAAFVVVFELLLPLLIVGRDPERVLELLLPTFAPVARALGPMTRWIARIVSRRRGAAPAGDAGRGGGGGERGRQGLHRHGRAGRASSRARSAGCCRASSTSATRWCAR